MKMKALLAASLFMFFEIYLTHSLTHGNEASLALIYTSNTLGEVEPCGTCPESGNTGGLARRAHYIQTVKEETKDLFILDGRDALVISFFGQPGEREKARKRAEFALRLYETLGYHVGRMNLRLLKGASDFMDLLPSALLQQNIEKLRKGKEDSQDTNEMKNLKELEQTLIGQKNRLPDPSGKNTYENFLILMHPEMKSDPEIQNMIDSSRDQLKRPIPY